MAVGTPIPTTPRYTAVITTSDPATGIIDANIKGDIRPVSVVSTGVAFRWPMVNETWVVRQENGIWYLDSPVAATTAPVSFMDINPGDAIINTSTGNIFVMGSSDGSTDGILSVLTVEAIPDMITLNDVTTFAGSTSFSTAYEWDDLADNGKIITISGAGSNFDDLRTSVSVSGGVATLNKAASETVSNAYAVFGTDAWPAWNTALSADIVKALPGSYMCSQSLILTKPIEFQCPGVTVDFSNASKYSDGNRYGIYGLGWIGQSATSSSPITYLTQDGKAGDMQIVVNTVSGIARDDRLVLACDGPRGKLAGGQNGLGGSPTVGLLMASTDTQFLVTPATNGTAPTAPFTAANCIVRIGSELIVCSTVTTTVISGITYYLCTVRSSPTGRGFLGNNPTFITGSGPFGAAASHTVNTTVVEHNNARMICKSTATQDQGEWHRVAYVDTVTLASAGQMIVYFDEPLDATYQVLNNASLRMATGLMDGVKFHPGLTVQMAPKNQQASGLASEILIGLTYCANVGAKGVTLLNSTAYGLRLVSCLGAHVVDNFADMGLPPYNTGTGARYAFAAEGGTQGVDFGNNRTKRGMCISFAQLNAGEGLWGVPRHCSSTGDKCDNSSTKEEIQHAAFQTEGMCRHITFTGPEANGCSAGAYLQGSHITLTGGVFDGWTRAGVQLPDDVDQISDVVVSGVAIGKRAHGAGQTVLTGGASGVGTNLGPADATIFVGQTILYFQGNAAAGRPGLANIVQVVGGIPTIIETFSFSGGTSTSFTGVKRGLNGTSGATITSGTFNQYQIVAFGTQTTTPVPIAAGFQTCLWPRFANQIITTLNQPIAITDTTITLNSVTGLPTSGMMMIEPQPLSGLPGETLATEVIAYNGISGNVLQNVQRGVNGTIVPGLNGTSLQSGTGKSHDAGYMIAQYIAGVKNITISTMTYDQDYDNEACFLQGYVPAENVKVINVSANNPTGIAFTHYAFRCEVPGASFEGVKSHGFPNGIFVTTGGVRLESPEVNCSFLQTTGDAIQMAGSRGTVSRPTVNQCSIGVRVASTATNTLIETGRINAGTVSTSGISDGGTATTKLNNYWDSGTALTAI